MCDFYCIWDLYHQYVTSEQVMLNRRATLLISYEHANRNYDRSKPHKKDEVGPFYFARSRFVSGYER